MNQLDIWLLAVEDPVTKAQRLSEFHKTLVKEANTSKPRFQEPKVDLEKIYNRFTKSKKEITVQDLQKEIKDTKSEVRNLKQELVILRVDHGLMDQRVKHLEYTSHQGNGEGTSLQNPYDEKQMKQLTLQLIWNRNHPVRRSYKPSVELTSKNGTPKSGLSSAKIFNLR